MIAVNCRFSYHGGKISFILYLRIPILMTSLQLNSAWLWSVDLLMSRSIVAFQWQLLLLILLLQQFWWFECFIFHMSLILKLGTIYSFLRLSFPDILFSMDPTIHQKRRFPSLVHQENVRSIKINCFINDNWTILVRQIGISF